MAVVLALAAAIVVGSGDFFGGLASRRGRVLAVALAVHGVGIVAMAVAGPLVGGDPTAADLQWGAAAGLAGGIGVVTLYRGFATSRVGIVAPISAVVAAAFPTVFGVLEGERPGALAAAGLVVGIVSISLVSRPDASAPAGTATSGIVHGLAAGLGFGALFIFLSRAEDGSGIWPMLPARVAGALLLLAAGLALRQQLRPAAGSWPPIVAGGVLTVSGTALFLLAAQQGLLSVVAVITSMYPAATVAWARVVFGERLVGIQLIGVVLALTAVALIAAG